MAGRNVLINSVMSAIPAHIMQCTMLPSSTCSELDKLNRDFLWGSTDEKKRLHDVNWETVTLDKTQGGLGISVTRDKNQAMLANFYWRLDHSNAPWALIMKNKYLNPMKATPNVGSVTWKAIREGKQALDRGLGWIIGKGDQVKAWVDKWVGNSSLRELIQGPQYNSDDKLLVKDLLDDHGNWDFSLLSFHLPDSITERIHAIPLSIDSTMVDKKIWIESPSGTPSVAAVHKTIRESRSFQDQEISKEWNWIWKCDTIPRIRYFLWQCNHDKIVTANLLSRRGMNINPLCSLCGLDVEDTQHALRACNHAKQIWINIGLPNVVQSQFFIVDFFSWMQENCESNSIHASGLCWKYIFTYAIWWIWKDRNSIVLKDKCVSPDITRMIIDQAREMHNILGKKESICITKTVQVRWEPPPHGWSKLNTDGSSIGNPGPAGAGGIIRNEYGEWIRGFQRKLGISNSLVAELWAIRDGLQIAKDLHIDSIYVESDAKEAVNFIVDSENEFRPLMPLIVDCRTLLVSFRRYKIRHIYREANKVADTLAKGAVELQERFSELIEPPVGILSVMMRDVYGVSDSRLVTV